MRHSHNISSQYTTRHIIGAEKYVENSKKMTAMEARGFTRKRKTQYIKCTRTSCNLPSNRSNISMVIVRWLPWGLGQVTFSFWPFLFSMWPPISQTASSNRLKIASCSWVDVKRVCLLQKYLCFYFLPVATVKLVQTTGPTIMPILHSYLP